MHYKNRIGFFSAQTEWLFALKDKEPGGGGTKGKYMQAPVLDIPVFKTCLWYRSKAGFSALSPQRKTSDTGSPNFMSKTFGNKGTFNSLHDFTILALHGVGGNSADSLH